MTRTIPAIPRRPAHRGGFTIIELLMVIIIIGILAAFLIPAISGARKTAQEAKVRVEITNFDAAIAQFKERYGVEPPSFVVLYEVGEANNSSPSWNNSTSPGMNLTAAHRRTSHAAIRQIWPDFDFAHLGDPPSNTNPGKHNPTPGNGAIDINMDGDETDVLILNGAECLTFFLGGIPDQVEVNGMPGFQPGSDQWNLTGFAENSRAPFAGRDIATARVQPFYEEFDPSRLVDVESRYGIDPVDELMPEFLDTLPGQELPYQFLSSYGGRGYQPWGLDGQAGASATDPLAYDNETLPAPIGLSLHYLAELPSATNPLAQNPNTYQIISPGYDHEFGVGGFYDGESVPATPPTRAVERDNISNIAGGRLN